MGSIRRIRFVACVFLCLLCTRSFAPTDLFHFLEDQRLTLLSPVSAINKQPVKVETYLVSDRWGNKYFLSVRSNSTALAMTGVYALLSSLGVHSIPTQPILVKRGNGIVMTLANAQAFQQQAKLPQWHEPTIRDGEWFGAYVQPVMGLGDPPSPEKLTPLQLVEAFEILVALHALRSPGSLYFRSGHFLLPAVTGYFAHLYTKDTPDRLLRNAVPKYVWETLKEFSPQQVELFLDTLIPFFDRLEWVGRQHLEAFLNPTIDALKEEGKFGRGVDSMPFRRKLVESFASARADFEAYLRERIGGNFRAVSLASNGSAPAADGQLALVPPLPYSLTWGQADLPSISDPHFRKLNSKYLLYAYFRASAQLRGAVFRWWQKEIGDGDPIELLLKDATQWDSTVFIFSPHRLPQVEGLQLVENPQMHLNASLPKTLVVYARNDREGELIHEIGMDVRPFLPIVMLRAFANRRARFDEKSIRRIIGHARDQGCNRVVKCELGSLRPELRQLFVDAGLELVELDHHNNQPENFQKRSVAELFMHMIGYSPRLDQLHTAMRDRSGISAFPQLGYERSDLDTLLRGEEGLRLLRGWTDRLGDVFFADPEKTIVPEVSNYNGPLGTLAMALGYLTYPTPPTFLDVSQNMVRVYGDPRLIWEVLKTVNGHHSTRNHRNVIFGGDGSRTMFVNIDSSAEDIEYVRHTVVGLIESNGTSALKNPCVQPLSIIGRNGNGNGKSDHGT